MRQKKIVTPPTLEQLERELKRERYRSSYWKTLAGTLYALMAIAAAFILLSTLMMPVFKVYGNGMSPSLQDGDIIMAVKGSQVERGEIAAFYYNNKVLIKRVIAHAGDMVDIDEEGNVTVNGSLLEEPYLEKKDMGQCDITFPYQVPGGRVFVMGDNRSISADSRSSSVGCISEEQMIGRVAAQIWPPGRMYIDLG